MDLAVIGHITVEYIALPDGVIGPVLGSPTSYTAIAGQKLGLRTGIVSRIGRDMPDDLLKPFRELEVDLSGLVCEGDSTRTNTLYYRPDGSKTAVYEKVAPPITIDNIPHAYFKAKAIMVCPMDYDIRITTVTELRRRYNGCMMADLTGFGGAVSASRPSSVRDRVALARNLVANMDIVKGSIEDCCNILGEEVEAEDAMEWLIGAGAGVAIVTAGRHGSLVGQGGRVHRIPAIPCELTDATGAGDVFGAGFLAEHLGTGDIERAGLLGAAAAAYAIERSGGASSERMPTREDALLMLQRLDGCGPTTANR